MTVSGFSSVFTDVESPAEFSASLLLVLRSTSKFVLPSLNKSM